MDKINAMNRVNRIIRHPLWRTYVDEIERLEGERRFCRHGIDHLLHVARLAYLENLENGMQIGKEQIYAAALLHDIGRSLEYTEGIPHEEAGFSLSQAILPQCGFGGGGAEEILRAVRSHRNKNVAKEKNLSGLIYRADKLSRNCFCCRWEKECDWKEEKKNREIRR